MENLKGFIKDHAGNIILPISRGELIVDALGNIALHSSHFKAEAAERDPDTKLIKSNTGKYGLITPEDLLDLHEALVRISIIETETGISGSGSGGDSLKQTLLDLINKVGYQKGEIIGKELDGTDITSDSDTGIYEYVNNKILQHLAQSDALKFKGTLGIGGNVTALPTTGINNGDTYKVITAGTYAGKKAKPGDLLIALYTPGAPGELGTFTWDLVPSGDEQELFLKIQQTIDGEKIDKIISGTVELQGTNGISITYDETNKKITVTGVGYQTETELSSIKARVSDLEATVNGRAAQGQPGAEGYVPPVVGLTYKTALLQLKINDAVTNWDDLVAKEEGTNNLIHGDDLVKASAVYDVTAELAKYITEADKKYLQAIKIGLETALSDDLKEYLKGKIVI